jgi:hypothetical protein
MDANVELAVLSECSCCGHGHALLCRCMQFILAVWAVFLCAASSLVRICFIVVTSVFATSLQLCILPCFAEHINMTFMSPCGMSVVP